jgi:hypothetical protein
VGPSGEAGDGSAVSSTAGPQGAIATGDGGLTSADPAAAAGTLIHIEDDGKIIDVQKGGSVVFVLASHAGTGFVWVPTRVDPAFLTQVGDRSSDVPNDIPGTKKYDVYHFTVGAAASGSSVVEMSLKRPFGNERIGRVIHVTVNAH